MTVVAPLRIGVSFSKRNGKHRNFSLNLNQYRNEHFQILNKAKINFKEHMKGQIHMLPKLTQVELTYILYPPTKALLDVSNICSIVDKFFCDALVEFGILPDDNFKHIPAVNYRFGNIDKDNPRIEIKIRDLTTNTIVILPSLKEEPMQIILTESEILESIESFVRKQINVADGMAIDIELKAGRGENGFTATLDIHPQDTPKATVASVSAAAEPVAKTTTRVKPKEVEEVSKAEVVEKTKEDKLAEEVAEEKATVDAGSLFGNPAEEEEVSSSIFG